MNKRVIIMGAGPTYQKRKDQILSRFEIVAVADSNLKNDGIISPDKISQYEYDYILICAKKKKTQIKLQLIEMGLDPLSIIDIELLDYLLQDHKRYIAQREEYQRKFRDIHANRFAFRQDEELPYIEDAENDAGDIDGHYFFQDILVANRIICSGVKEHADVASRVDGLVSHLLAAGIEVTEFDIRELDTYQMDDVQLPNLLFKQGDATSLQNIEDESIKSLSSLHAVEHFGLGRYGDPIDPEAWRKVILSFQRVLKKGGRLYLSVPVGKEEKLCFNAHRIFNPLTITESCPELRLDEFYLIHNKKIRRYSKEEYSVEHYRDSLGEYDCGVFILSK